MTPDEKQERTNPDKLKGELGPREAADQELESGQKDEAVSRPLQVEGARENEPKKKS